RGWRPDLLVCDAFEFAGPVVGAVLGVPNVAHSFGPRLPEEFFAAAQEHTAELWEANGLEPRPYGGVYDHLYLDIYPPSLQRGEAAQIKASQSVRPETFVTGGGDAGAAEPDWLPPGSDPLLYVTFGTTFSDVGLVKNVVEGVRELPVRVVATTGG